MCYNTLSRFYPILKASGSKGGANMPYMQNYAQQMSAVLADIAQSGRRPTLLLHACCGPCSSAVLEMLSRYFQITILYYNPNTWPEAEYLRRGEELARFVEEAHPLDVKVVEEEYVPSQFYEAVRGLENEPERGSRCTVCYRLRMEHAAQYAKAHGFEWFTTTLSISPHKDAVRINQIGQELEKLYGVRHLPSDFKKQNGYLRSLQLSKDYGLYRQDYCGCEFSAKAREASQNK
jgi:predicted adenine nucleotide alpha hydrolase (AANH) superfamily ATPase